MVFYTSTCTHREVWNKVKNDNHRKDGEKFEKCGITSKFRNPGFHGQYWTFMWKDMWGQKFDWLLVEIF